VAKGIELKSHSKSSSNWKIFYVRLCARINLSSKFLGKAGRVNNIYRHRSSIVARHCSPTQGMLIKKELRILSDRHKTLLLKLAIIPTPAILTPPSSEGVSHCLHWLGITSRLLRASAISSTTLPIPDLHFCLALVWPILWPCIKGFSAFYPIEARVSCALLEPPEWYWTWRKSCGRWRIFLRLVDFKVEEHASDGCTWCYEDAVTFDSGKKARS